VTAFERSLAALLLAFALGGAQVAIAQGYVCAVSSVGSLDFMIYDPASPSPATASGTVTLTCTHVAGAVQRINWSMQLSNGGSGDCAARAMTGPTGALGYNVYQNSVGGGVWGNAGCRSFPTGQLSVGPGAGNNTRSVSNRLLGQIPSGQYVSAGSYGETLTLTISY
jgi:spore coat protein U-like protein